MSERQSMHYKEQRPEETAEYLKGILKNLGIAVQEKKLPKSSIGTYSMRVSFESTDLGSNGKGVTEAYTEASAYAELLERIQNGHLNPWGFYEIQAEGFCHCPDERLLISQEIAEMAEENSFLSYYFTYRGLIKLSVEDRARAFEKIHKVEQYFGRGRDSYEVRPYYSVKKRRVEYVPYYLCLTHYVSNGMCAGNTPYEALVQGFSEIMERHVQKKIFLEKPCLPDVPDSYIRKFPQIWEMLQIIRSIPGICAYMKDGSFGGEYPVAVLILVSMNTGRYGVKLGCHPDFGIAMERTLTEACQGGDLKEYCGRSWIDFENQGVDSPANIYNSYKFGQAQYPCELFGDSFTYSFTPVPDVSGLTNQELFEKLAHKFLDKGYDILLRDVSYLGFPSYQMLIPGFSEVQQETDLMAKVYNTRAYLAPYLAYPERMNLKNAKLLLGILEYWADSPMENQMTQIYSVYPDTDFPGEEVRKGWLYLSAMCSFMLGRYREAAEKILNVLSFSRAFASPKQGYYRVLYEYLILRDTGKEHSRAIRQLKKFFDASLCDRVDECMSSQYHVLERIYPRCDYQRIYGDKLSGECAVWLEVRKILFKVYKKNVPNQKVIGELFEGVYNVLQPEERTQNE